MDSREKSYLALARANCTEPRDTGSNLMPTLAEWRAGVPTPRHSSLRRPRSHRRLEAHQKKSSHPDDTPPANRPNGPATHTHRLGISLAPADVSWRERVGREIAGLLSTWGELRLVGSLLFTVMFGAIQGSTLDHGFSMEWVDWYNNRRLFEAAIRTPPARRSTARSRLYRALRRRSWPNDTVYCRSAEVCSRAHHGRTGCPATPSPNRPKAQLLSVQHQRIRMSKNR